MADVIETIKQLVRAGASSEEIVATLKSMGVDEEEARKLILLAERDMLRVLRNEIREIAKDAFDERAEEMKKALIAEIREALDAEIRLSRRRLVDMLRDEVNRYAAELRDLSDRVDRLERRVYDLEQRISRIPVYRRRGKSRAPAYVLTLLGIGGAAAAIFLGLEGTTAYVVFMLSVLLLIGGAFLGARSV